MKDSKKVYESPIVEVVKIDKDINVCAASGIGTGSDRPNRPGGGGGGRPRSANTFEANPFEQNSFKQNPFAK